MSYWILWLFSNQSEVSCALISDRDLTVCDTRAPHLLTFCSLSLGKQQNHVVFRGVGVSKLVKDSPQNSAWMTSELSHFGWMILTRKWWWKRGKSFSLWIMPLATTVVLNLNWAMLRSCFSQKLSIEKFFGGPEWADDGAQRRCRVWDDDDAVEHRHRESPIRPFCHSYSA